MPNRDSAPAEFTRLFALRMTPELDDAVRARADAEGRTIAEVLRRWIEEGLAKPRETA